MTESRRPLLWHQGLLLQPQHFQQLELHFQSLLYPFHKQLQPYFWGIADLQLQNDALQNRMFEIVGLEAIFPDGTRAVFPGNSVIQPRSFDSVDFDLEGGGKPFKVYLGLKKFRPSGPNATSTGGEADLYSIATRFVCPDDPEDVEDLYLGGPPAKTRFLQYVLKIFWESELEQLGDYWLLPVAQLELEGERVRSSPDFIPPAFSLAGSEKLHRLFKSIQEMITSRCRILEIYKIFRDVSTTGIEAVSLRNLLALTVINRYIPAFHHLLETPAIHPWTAYGLLRQFVGELSTFSDRIDALGRLADGRQLLPAYDHRELGLCFSEARRLVQELLNAIVVGEESVVHLAREGNDFKGQIPTEAFGQATRFILAVTCPADSETVIDSLTNLAKVGSLEEMPTMIARALPGIPLIWQETAPPGLPERPDVFYLALKADHPLWADIRRSGNICLHWDEAPEDASAELIISRF